jgi:hypothetical protein
MAPDDPSQALAAINRAACPTSKAQLAHWYHRTILPRLLPATTDQLTAILDQLQWFETKMNYLRDKSAEILRQQVNDRRSNLSDGIHSTARARMIPAYDEAHDIRGPGMKRNILNIVQARARKSATPLHNSIETDLTGGLAEVWLLLEASLEQLFDEVAQKAEQVVHNANIDLKPRQPTPNETKALEMIPEIRVSLASLSIP